MGVGAGLYMYVVVVQKFTFAISSPDEFLFDNSRYNSSFSVVYSKNICVFEQFVSLVNGVCLLFRHVQHLWRWFRTKAATGSEC